MEHHASLTPNLSLSEIYFSKFLPETICRQIVKSYPFNTFDIHSEVRHCQCTTDCSHKWTDIHNIFSWKTNQLKLCFTITDICSIKIYFYLKTAILLQFCKILTLNLYRKACFSNTARTERAICISTMKTIEFPSPAAAQQLWSKRGWGQLRGCRSTRGCLQLQGLRSLPPDAEHPPHPRLHPNRQSLMCAQLTSKEMPVSSFPLLFERVCTLFQPSTVL